MAQKPAFTTEQHEVLHAAAQRVWKDKFKWMKPSAEHPGGQEAMALALGVSQQTVSALLKGKYKPGVKVARAIANLDGQRLEELVGDFAEPDAATLVQMNGTTFMNLDVCIQFHASTKHWSPWTIAAARAGFFGQSDFAAPEWASKLDILEKTLEKARR